MKYPHKKDGWVYFNEALIVADEPVKIKWYSNIKNYYTNLGYIFTKVGDTFDVDIQHLQKGSHMKVNAMCVVCGLKRDLVFKNLINYNNSKCLGCAQIKDRIGIFYNRLEVIDYAGIKKGRGAMWLCKCECGKIVVVRGNSLETGATQSCGCLNDELVKGRHGDKHPRWNPDITDEEREIGRNYPELRQWRDTIKSNDDYTCQSCNERGGKLVSHHLNNYSDFPDERVDLENGVTLCRDCHYKFHNWMGNYRIKCTDVDLANFCHEFYPDAFFLTK